MDFCHLHCHTQYSLLDGAAGIDTMMQRAKEKDIPAMAITDHGNLYGVPEFYTTAEKHGIQPIVGCEFYVTPSGHRDKKDRTRYHQVLLAKNETGYRNLIKLSSRSYTEGFYYKPRIDMEMMREHHEGLIATTCCLQGWVLQTILKQGEEAARQVFEAFLDVFQDDYYIEIQDHDIDDQHTCNEVLLRWSKEYDVDVIATNDVHYVDERDAEAQDILLCLQTGKDYKDPNRMRFSNDQFYLKDAAEMTEALTGIPEAFQKEALVNTADVAAKCNFELQMGDLLMPHYPIPDGFEGMDDYLRHLTFERAKERYGDPLSQDVVDRLNHELGIIKEMGYSGYFLIVQDFTQAARDLDVRVGPGRGSAAGSAVSYCLGITNVEPLQYDLLFERFLNPERVSMPDIDIDFDDRGRSKVIDYVVKKYGRENVCQIITFGTMGAKTVVRDVSRVLDVSLDRADEIAKMIPEGPGVSLESAFEDNPDFRELKDADDPSVRKMMNYAEVLEGSVRHTGVHAAGVIIAPGEVSNYVPVSVSKSKGEKVITTQYDGDWVEDFGLLKMDFLGLKTLTVINDAIELIEQKYPDVTIHLDEIPLDDEETYKLFQRGDTVSIFQFESTGMREWMRKLKPTELNDLIAMNALYRPGPMENIPTYIDRKQGREVVEYPHPMLEDILKPTYGIPVYQEQVMQIAQEMGDFSLGKADILRRGMGKKKAKVVNKMKGQFVEGAKAQDVDEETIEEVWELMAKFAGYGFNKSHSAAYSIVAYQTAFLKAHFPAEFLAAAMTNDMGNNDKLSIVLEEARRMGIEVLPPSINYSKTKFSVQDEAIRFGMGAVKGAGVNAIESIIETRDKEGPFETIFSMAKNLDLQVVGKRTLEALAQAGALDELEGTRAQLADAVESAVRYGQKVQTDRMRGQNSLFGNGEIGSSAMEPKLDTDVEPWPMGTKLKKEHEVLGFYVSGHPLDEFRAEADAFASAHFGDTDAIETLIENHGGDDDGGYGRDRGPVRTFCGIITEIKRHTTRSGKPIAFGTIEDFTGAGELVCFSTVLDRAGQYLNVDEVVLVKGNVEMRGGQVKVLVKDILPMWKVREQKVEEVILTVDAETIVDEELLKLKSLCENNRGHCKLYFDLKAPELSGPERLRSRIFVIEPTSEFMKGAQSIIGSENIRLTGTV